MDDPWAKPGLGGMTAYPPKAMAAVCILMEAEMKTYRDGRLPQDAPGYSPQDRAVQGPSKSTIWRAYGMIPEPYLREVHLGSCATPWQAPWPGTVQATPATGLSGGSASTAGPRPSAGGSSCTASSTYPPGSSWTTMSPTDTPPTSPACGLMDRLGGASGDGNFFCGLGLPGQAAVRRDSQPGLDTPYTAQIQHRLQERRQPGLGGHDPDAQGRP